MNGYYTRQSGKIFLMKRVLVAFVVFLILSLNTVFAHGPGQQPFFKIDGKFSGYYLVPTSSVPDFILPQDIAPENYLVGQKIDFEIDTNFLPIAKNYADKIEFDWDFGDGSKGAGLKNSHIYPKRGSYFLTINAKYEQGYPPMLLQSTLINILPSPNYQLPKAVIEVNGWQSSDPLTDILETKFNKEFKFDATKSQSSSEIIEYVWDFGDKQAGSGPTTSHQYEQSIYTVFPVLRIKNADGFIADSFVQLKDQDSITSLVKVSDSQNPIFLIITIAGFVIVLIAFLSAFIIKKIKRR